MLREKLDYAGVVDVSIIVISSFENPARIDALKFLKDVLSWKIKAIIPVTAFIGAYHILTRYLKLPKKEIKDVIRDTLNIPSPAIFEDISSKAAIEAIEYAVAYNMESWDGYIVYLAKEYASGIIYSIDKDFEKVEGVNLVIPISEKRLNEYHKFIEKMLM